MKIHIQFKVLFISNMSINLCCVRMYSDHRFGWAHRYSSLFIWSSGGFPVYFEKEMSLVRCTCIFVIMCAKIIWARYSELIFTLLTMFTWKMFQNSESVTNFFWHQIVQIILSSALHCIALNKWAPSTVFMVFIVLLQIVV